MSILSSVVRAGEREASAFRAGQVAVAKDNARVTAAGLIETPLEAAGRRHIVARQAEARVRQAADQGRAASPKAITSQVATVPPIVRPTAAASASPSKTADAAHAAGYAIGFAEGKAMALARIRAITADPRARDKICAAVELAIASPTLSPDAVCAVIVGRHVIPARASFQSTGRTGIVYGALPDLPGAAASDPAPTARSADPWADIVGTLNATVTSNRS